MVPAAIVPVESLPVMPNGKVDRTALEEQPVRAGREAQPPGGGVEPRVERKSGVEEVVAGIWSEVLGVDGAGPGDDFFASGGHSLLAMKLIHDVNDALGVELTVRSLLVEPTLGALVQDVERDLADRPATPAPVAEAPVSRSSDGESPAGPTDTSAASDTRYPPLVPIKPGGDLPPVFLVAGGMGGEQELLVYAKLARYLDPRQPFYGLRARGVDELVEPHESVEAMAAEYVEEIRHVQPHGPYYLSGSCVGGVVAFELAQQLRAAGEDVPLLVLIDSNYPTRRRTMRNQLVILWRDTLPPNVGRSSGPRGVAEHARHRARVWFSPTEDERIGMRRSAIGNRYLRRILGYRAEPYEGELTLIACGDRQVEDAGRVWRELAAGGLEIRYVPGDHYTHLREHVSTTAAALEDCLRRSREGRAPGTI
jgi:thioesterase domain-containing protein/acyl carrier protein